jgi:aminoglycoside phosphotransferase
MARSAVRSGKKSTRVDVSFSLKKYRPQVRELVCKAIAAHRFVVAESVSVNHEGLLSYRITDPAQYTHQTKVVERYIKRQVRHHARQLRLQHKQHPESCAPWWERRNSRLRRTARALKQGQMATA